MTMKKTRKYKTYAIGCRSRVSGQEGMMKSNGKLVTFKMRHYAEKYAAKYRSMDYHHWVIELNDEH